MIAMPSGGTVVYPMVAAIAMSKAGPIFQVVDGGPFYQEAEKFAE